MSKRRKHSTIIKEVIQSSEPTSVTQTELFELLNLQTFSKAKIANKDSLNREDGNCKAKADLLPHPHPPLPHHRKLMTRELVWS